MAVLAALAVIAVSCGRRPVYSHFEHIPSTGWQHDDTLHFIFSARETGTYGLNLSLRATSIYPFTELALAVKSHARLSHEQRTDTLFLDITDKDGNRRGDGISMFSYATPLTPVELQANDTLDISVRHAMTRHCLEGITDVGITVNRH